MRWDPTRTELLAGKEYYLALWRVGHAPDSGHHRHRTRRLIGVLLPGNWVVGERTISAEGQHKHITYVEYIRLVGISWLAWSVSWHNINAYNVLMATAKWHQPMREAWFHGAHRGLHGHFSRRLVLPVLLVTEEEEPSQFLTPRRQQSWRESRRREFDSTGQKWLYFPLWESLLPVRFLTEGPNM